MTNTTAQDFRDMAAAAEKEKETSFERCDTDGFLSQWGHGMMAQQYRLQAEIEENGGLWEYAALFDLQGNLVPAKEVETRYGGQHGPRVRGLPGLDLQVQWVDRARIDPHQDLARSGHGGVQVLHPQRGAEFLQYRSTHDGRPILF